jgi:hypothetical protein
VTLPARIKRQSGKADEGKRSPAHRTWVRGHACSACGSTVAIEAAHVRNGTDGGTGIKPSDRWVISLCRDCHGEQHRIGEPSFQARHQIDMKAMAEAFFRASPHRSKLS